MMKRRILCSILCLSVLSLVTSSAQAQGKAAKGAKKSSPDALQFFSKIAKVQNKGDYEIAAEDWSKFLKRYGKDPLVNQARHYLGVCYMQLKRYPLAVKSFDQVRRDTAKDKGFKMRQDTLLNLGWCQYTIAESDAKQKPLYAAAIQTLSELLNKHPKGRYTDQALYFRAESLYLSNKKIEAIKDYSKLTKEHTKSPLHCDSMYALGVTHEELADYKIAGKVYDDFIKSCTKSQYHSEVRMRKAEVVLQMGLASERKSGLAAAKSQLKQAELLFAEVSRIKGFDAIDHALLRQGFAIRRQNRFIDAAAVYRQLISSHPKSRYLRDAKLAVGRCYFNANQTKEAAEWLEQVAAGKDAISAEAMHWLCRVYIKQNKPQLAINRAQVALRNVGKTPFAVNLKMDLADALYETGQGKAKAVELYKQIASDSPRHDLAPQAVYNAAFGAMELRKHEDALKLVGQFERSYAKHPLLQDAKYVAAESLLQLNRFAEAQTAFNKLISDNPRHPQRSQWQIRYGASMYIAKKYDAALKLLDDLSEKLAVKSQLAEVHFLRGACNFSKNKFDAAVKCFRSSLLSDALWTRADENMLFLARAQRKMKNIEQARTTAKMILKQFKNSKIIDQVHYRLGEFAYAGKDYQAAKSHYTTVLDKWPNSKFAAFAEYGKAWSQLKSKEFANAHKSFDAFLAVHGKHPLLGKEALFARGMAARQLGQHTKALTDLASFLQTKPAGDSKADALYEQGLAQVGLKKPKQALASFKEILANHPRYSTTQLVLYETGWAHKSLNQSNESVKYFGQLATQFPRHALAGEAHFHVGEFHYANKRFDVSLAHYIKCWQANEAKPLGEKAIYKLAWSNYQLKKYAEAQKAFREQLKHYSKGALRTDAAFMEAESFFKLKKYKEALATYMASRTAIAADPNASADVKSLVLLHSAQSAGQIGKWTQSASLLDELLKKYKRGPYVPEAYYELGWANQNLKKYNEALEKYDEAATRGTGELSVRARFMAGEVLFERKKYNLAIRQFRRAMLAYGKEATAVVKNWQSKSGFEAARCAEVQIRTSKNAAQRARLIADAIKFYRYVVEKHPRSQLVAKAKKRLSVLNKIGK